MSNKEVLRGEVEVVRHDGKQILLPKDMKPEHGIEWLQRFIDDQNTQVAVHEEVEAFPLDGAYAFAKAIARRYGFSQNVPTPGFFGSNPPAMVSVEVAPGVFEQVPWGRIKVPGVNGFLQTMFSKKDNRLIFAIGGQVSKAHRKEIAELAQLTRGIVKEESIYKGQAIKISFPEDEDDMLTPEYSPDFIDTRKIRQDELVFSQSTKDQIDTSLFSAIEKTEQARRFEVPLKRGVLLEGPYGTGKTMTAYVTAKKCHDNGWTFVYLDDVRNLEDAIIFAKQYQPAVVFAEDIDQVLKGERGPQMNAILNTIDGIATKDSDVITILTTNHVEDIEPAMLRPGRLDAVVSVQAPDEQAVEKLLHVYGRGLIKSNEDVSTAAKKLAGQIPASIRETVERAKLSAIRHLGDDEDLSLTANDLVVAADGMLQHLDLLERNKRKPEASKLEKAANVLGNVLSKSLANSSHQADVTLRRSGYNGLPDVPEEVKAD